MSVEAEELGKALEHMICSIEIDGIPLQALVETEQGKFRLIIVPEIMGGDGFEVRELC